MDAKEFIRTLSRMCKHNVERGSCVKCLLNDAECFRNPDVDEQLVDIVEKWAKENPAKTRQSEFLKMFPNADVA